MQKTEMRIDKKLNLRAIAISNWLLDTHSYSKKKKRYSIQFFDYDYNGDKDRLHQATVYAIMKIFPYDCIMYETKHGIQFISFSLLKGLHITKSRVLETSRLLGEQDYWNEAKDLALRVSSKWSVNRFGNYKIVSERPRFKGVAKYPDSYRISNQHLEFYYKFMGLPKWVYELYENCHKFNHRIKTYHYKTRD